MSSGNEKMREIDTILTVGDLLRALSDLPPDTPVFDPMGERILMTICPPHEDLPERVHIA